MTGILRTIVKALAFSVVANEVFGAGLPMYKDVDNAIRGLALTGSCPTAIPALAYKEFDPVSLKNQIGRCQKSLKSKVTILELAPVHLAVMNGNIKAIAPLTKAGADINARDFQGYTPLHHAAMKADFDAVKALLSLNANKTLRTNYGATYMDLLRMNAPFSKQRFPLDETQFSAHTREDYQTDPQCFAKGVTFTHELVARPETLIHLWQHGKIKDLTKEEIAEYKKTRPQALANIINENKMYLAFKTNPPKLIIKRVTQDDYGNPINAPFCGLFADQPIKQGTLIAEYVGELLTEDQKNDLADNDRTYLWTDSPIIDAQQYRSAAAMANDGFPNANVKPLERNSHFRYGIDGLSGRKMLYALQDIEAGEEIIIDYGPYDATKEIERIELRSKALLKFFRKHSWGNILKALKELDIYPEKFTEKDHKDIEALMYQWFYVLNTPAALRFLVENGLYSSVDLEQVKKAQTDPLFPAFIKERIAFCMPNMELEASIAAKMAGNHVHDEL